MDRKKDQRKKQDFPGSRHDKPRRDTPAPGNRPEDRPFQEGEDEE